MPRRLAGWLPCLAGPAGRHPGRLAAVRSAPPARPPPTQAEPSRCCPVPLIRRGAITGKEAGVEELVLAEKIIAHLIKREQVRLLLRTIGDVLSGCVWPWDG